MPARFGPNSHIAEPATGNLLLDALPAQTLARLRPHLYHRAMLLGTVVAAAKAPIAHALFPTDCVISTVARMSDGDAVEVGLTGRSGVVGAWLALRETSPTHESMVQVSGNAWVILGERFAQLLDFDPSLNDSLLRYTQFSMVSVMYFMACNVLHSLEERYARWLLMVHDRVQRDGFHLTQEYAGQMLGVRRASVTQVANAFSRLGLISYHRGDLTIIDRAALEETACECYASVNGEMQRLLGYNVHNGPRGSERSSCTTA